MDANLRELPSFVGDIIDIYAPKDPTLAQIGNDQPSWAQPVQLALIAQIAVLALDRRVYQQSSPGSPCT